MGLDCEKNIAHNENIYYFLNSHFTASSYIMQHI